MKRFTRYCLGSFIVMFCIPAVAQASELRLDSYKAVAHVGEQFAVDVVLHADARVNALEAHIMFPSEQLRFVGARDGKSVMNIWIERPALSSPGEIVFSGVTPGGIIGPEQHIVSLLFEARHDGDVLVSFEQTHALLNDGQGTEAPMVLRSTLLSVEAGESNTDQREAIDHDPPEFFMPMVAKDPLLFDGQWFAVFSTQDKGSGMSAFWVKESRFSPFMWFQPWRIVQSPYVLKDQDRKSFIVMKAMDHAGNERRVTVEPNSYAMWYESMLFWGILGAIVIFIFCMCIL